MEKPTEELDAPVRLSEEEVAVSSKGGSEKVLRAMVERNRPVQLDEEDVKAAGRGQSEEMMKRKMKS